MERFVAVDELVRIVIHYVEGYYGRDIVLHVPTLHLAAHHAAVIGDDSVGEERLFGTLHLDNEMPFGVGDAIDVEHNLFFRFRLPKQFGWFVGNTDDIFHDIRQERPEERDQPLGASLGHAENPFNAEVGHRVNVNGGFLLFLNLLIIYHALNSISL